MLIKDNLLLRAFENATKNIRVEKIYSSSVKVYSDIGLVDDKNV